MVKHGVVAPALLVAVIAAVLTGCATIQAASTRSTEQMLAAAGFHTEPADTPERAAHLQRLPARKLTLERYGVEPLWVYADPDVCVCTYVGTESQYQEYQRLIVEQRLADERLQASVNWGPWGAWPWGRWGAWPGW